MNSETLSLILRAQDETAGAISKMAADVHGLTGKFETGGKAAGAFGNILKGIGMGIGIAIFNDLQMALGKITELIPSLIEKGLKFAETVHTISEVTGASSQQSSRLTGIFEFLGVSTDGLGMKMGRLAKLIVDHADQMHKFGIATTDASGKTLNMLTIIDNARHSLSRYSDGAEKTAVAVKLFGRAGADLIEYLNLTDGQIKMLNAEMDKLGITMDEQGIAKAKGLSREFNLFGLSVQGVANQLLNDVAPALMSTVDQLASWVAANGRNIANFAAEVANFVLGMISALTGASFSTVTFSDKFASLGTVVGATGGALDATTDKTNKGAGASKAATTAIDNHVKALDAQLTKLKALEAEEDKKFAKDMARISAKLGLELSSMDTAEKAHSIEEQRASSVRDLADAQDALAKAQAGNATAAGDYAVQMMQAQDALAKAQTGSKDTKTGAITIDDTAVAAAQQRLVDLQAGQTNAAQSQVDAVKAAQDRIASITHASADLEASIKNDARRAQIAAVQAFVEAEMKSEQEATNKKKFVEREKKEAVVLESQIAAAAARGDLVAVSDLTIQLHAVQTATIRAEQAKRNTDREADLTKQKAQLEDLKKAAASAGGSIGDSLSGGADTGGKAISTLSINGIADAMKLAVGFNDPKTGVSGALESARLAGMKFGTDLKAVMKDVAGFVGTVTTGVLGVATAIGGLHLDGGAITMIGIAMAGLAVATANIPLAMAAIGVISMGSAIGPGDQKLPGIGALGPAQSPDVGRGVNRDANGNWIGPGISAGPRAAGGPVSGGAPYIVGERGPELFIPGQSGGIVPNGAGGGTVTFGQGAIIVNGQSDPQATAREVMLAIKRELTRQGTSFSSGY